MFIKLNPSVRSKDLILLLEKGDWAEHTDRIQGLKTWEHYNLLKEAYQNLNEKALYRSHLHGKSHIHRVLLLAALIAKEEGLTEEDVRLYFDAASYHDVGRQDDSHDLNMVPDLPRRWQS